MMQQKNSSGRNTGVGVAFLLISTLLMAGCGLTKSTGSHPAKSNQARQANSGAFNLQTAQQAADTLRIRQFLAGSWTLDSICRSTFTGLSCDTSIKQTWQLDSLGSISWINQGDDAGRDQYHFVPRDGAQAGSTKGKNVWVMYLGQARRGYLIRSLTKNSLSISDYPLIMDNTTTYHLSR